MTKEEFLEKYKDIDFYFYSYSKYVFTYKGKTADGKDVCIHWFGNSDSVYEFDVLVDTPENIYNIDPYQGAVYDSKEILDSFYDY